ncbi:MAG: amidohydrolase family protein [Planctomycetes bacterium]|nr:amidohydrolase family protein [Planctomycetota bacterium]
MDATVVPSPGRRIEDATVLVRDGRIVAVGRGVSVPDDAEVISARGGFVYAGFIDAGNSKLLSSESAPKPIVGRPMDFSSDVLAATRPDNRKGLTPQFCAAEVLQLDPKKLEALRQSGITTVHLVPAGRIASGQSAVVTTSGVPLREAVLQPNLFGQFQLYAPCGRTYPATLMGATAHLRQLFLDARRYRRHAELFREKPNQIPRPPFDPTLLALQRILDGSQRPLFLANSRDEIHRALDFAREQRLKIALWGASGAAECISRLRRERPGLIVQVDFGDPPKIEDSLPGTKPTPGTKPSELTPEVKPPLRAQRDKQDRWKHRVGSLAELNKAGLRFAVSSRKLDHPADILKNLRTAIEHGLPRDAALAALTTNAAKLLGLSDRLGTIEPGKLAHLVVLTAPFDDKQAKVRFVFVDGLKFEYNKQKEAVREAASPRRPDKAASVDVSGRWQMEIQSGKAPFPAELTLLPEGPKLSGTFSSTQGDGRVTEGRVSGDRITFTVAIGAGDRAIHLKFSGTCQKTTMSGTVSSPFGRAAPWKAIRREEPNEPDNPIQLALEPVVVETPAAAPKKSSASPSGKAPAGPETASKKKADELPAGAWPTELEKDRRAARRGNGNLFVRGGTIWTGTGQTLRNASILIERGKIKAIGQGLTPPKGTLVVDARGRFILPGLIDTHSHIMIAGGTNENTQSIVAEVRVRDAIQTDDVSEYRALAGGVTTASAHGSANVIGGQHAGVKLKYGATAREHLVPNAPQGVKFALGENPKGRPKRFPRSRPGVEATLRRAFAEAARYQEQWRQFRQAVKRDKNLLPPRRDLRLEALADILSHKKFMDCHCYRADEILMVFRVAESFGFRVNSLQHALEAYKVAPEVAAHGASCSTFSDWWAYKVEAYDATPYNVALLTRAGVNAVLKSDNAELMRHLYQEAAKMLRYGDLPADQALQTITLNAARELKLEGRIGTIEVGKDGDLAIFNGHPLNAFARCEMTIIEGVVYFERQKQPSAMSAAPVRSTSSILPRSAVGATPSFGPVPRALWPLRDRPGHNPSDRQTGNPEWDSLDRKRTDRGSRSESVAAGRR